MIHQEIYEATPTGGGMLHGATVPFGGEIGVGGRQAAIARWQQCRLNRRSTRVATQ